MGKGQGARKSVSRIATGITREEKISQSVFLRNDRGRGERGKVKGSGSTVKGMRIFLLQHGAINLYTQRN